MILYLLLDIGHLQTLAINNSRHPEMSNVLKCVYEKLRSIEIKGENGPENLAMGEIQEAASQAPPEAVP